MINFHKLNILQQLFTDSQHPVSTVVSYDCNPRTRAAYTSTLVCRENGQWQNSNTGQYMNSNEVSLGNF